ncbi:MAG: peptidoglycan DD-metalloendopeptidase family protein [Deltaproteobacteria bacterium]|nr:peptidoglycan DD-metalloendopeptidase family protein [Deltaproteobacteria bacterium]
MTRRRGAAPAAWLAAITAASALVSADAFATSFRLPSTCADGCMTVTAYYDYGGSQDWACGSNTYPGHRGTDFAPFGSWSAMDEGRSVVAAADGEVIATNDGEFDRCNTGDCAGGGGFGNYVALRHDDGKVTYYAHLRMGTVRVGMGARVACGQELGLVGSSGYSTGPHVHFEVRPDGGSADDPFGGGDCSGPLSYWVAQGAYRALPGTECESTAPAPTDAAAVQSVVPAAGTVVTAGARFEVRVTMRNTGNTTWTDGESYLLTHDGDARFEAPEQIRLDGATVGPDATHEFRFEAIAPSTAGEHVGYWRMDRFGTARFGDRSEVRIVVEEAPVPPEDAGAPADAGQSQPTRDGGGTGRDAAATVDAASRTDASAGARPLGDDALSGGCGCDLTPSPSEPSGSNGERSAAPGLGRAGAALGLLVIALRAVRTWSTRRRRRPGG